jgi:PAS domain S-box-containing protein
MERQPGPGRLPDPAWSPGVALLLLPVAAMVAFAVHPSGGALTAALAGIAAAAGVLAGWTTRWRSGRCRSADAATGRDADRPAGAKEPLAFFAAGSSRAVAVTDAGGRIAWTNEAFDRWFPTLVGDRDRPLGEEGGPAPALSAAFRRWLDTGDGGRIPIGIDGDAVDMRLDVEAMLAGGRPSGFVLTLVEAESQRRLEARILAGRRQVEAILDAVPSLVVFRDARGRVMRANAAAARFFGHEDTRELEGRPYAEIAPEHAATALVADRQVCNTGLSTFGALELVHDHEQRLRVLRTDRVWLEDPETGTEGVLSVATDVTDERDLQSRLDVAMQAGGLGTWEWEPQASCLSLSSRLLSMLGHEPGGIAPTFDGFIDLVHAEDRPRIIDALETGVLRQTDGLRCEARIRRGDGSWCWMLLAGRVQARGTRGRADRVVGVLVDISRQKEDQTVLADALHRAEAAGRARSAFLASMSHELRTPLTSILGYAELLREGGPVGGTGRTCAETILRNGRHLLSIIDDVLDLSRIEVGRLQTDPGPVEIGGIVRDVLETLGPRAAAKGLSLEVELAGPLPRRIVTDAVRLRQVLLNIVGNAVKFTDAGEVRIRLAAPVDDTGVRRLRVAVRDTGPGIAPDVQQRLFQPFERADDAMNRRHGGAGLGLAISRRLARMLGGDVRVRSRSGRGSTFIVDVPSGDPPAAASEPAVRTVNELLLERPGSAAATGPSSAEPAVVVDGALRGRRILLAEDGPDNQRLIGHHLRGAGAVVDTAADGAEAVDMIRHALEASVRYDLVVMDMQMPVMDGYEATRTLRAAGCDVPILALTAHAMRGDRDRCLAAGCSDYATKPIDRHRLLAGCTALIAAREADQRPHAA